MNTARPFSQAFWDLIPGAVQAYIEALEAFVAALEGLSSDEWPRSSSWLSKCSKPLEPRRVRRRAVCHKRWGTGRGGSPPGVGLGDSPGMRDTRGRMYRPGRRRTWTKRDGARAGCRK